MGEELHKVEILNLKAEDVIMIKVNSSIGYSSISEIGEYYQNKFPENKIILSDENIDISIIREDKEVS